jgi:hypothetical protein
MAADVTRVLARTGAKPRVTFTTDSGTTDLDGTCTVTATNPAGATVAGTPLAASHVAPAGSGTYEWTLPPQPDPTLLRQDWSGAISGVAVTVTTWVEIVGGFLFTLAELRAVSVDGRTPFTDTSLFGDQRLREVRDEVTEDFEARAGWSFIPRYERELLDGDGSSTLLLAHPKPQRVLAASVSGTALDSSGLADLKLGEHGAVRRATLGSWTAGVQNVTVEYVHGWAQVPAAVKTAALGRAAMLLVPSLGGSAASSWTTPDGTTYTYDPAGRTVAGMTQHYGIPKLDSVLNAPAYRCLVGGVA